MKTFFAIWLGPELCAAMQLDQVPAAFTGYVRYVRVLENKGVLPLVMTLGLTFHYCEITFQSH